MVILILAIHLILAVGVIYFGLTRMRKNAELGGAFGSGAMHTMFGREKGLDKEAKWALVFGVLFMLSCFLTASILA